MGTRRRGVRVRDEDRAEGVVEDSIPTLSGLISPEGQARILDQPGEAGRRLDAYFGTLRDRLATATLPSPLHGWILWQLTATRFHVEPSDEVIPDEIRGRWLNDAEGCIRRLAASPAGSFISSRIFVDGENSWQFVGSSTHLSAGQISELAKSLDESSSRVLRPEERVSREKEHLLTEPARDESLITAAAAAGERLKETIDSAVTAMSDPAQLDDACDEYQAAAQNFAAKILEHRIRRSFAGMVDPADGRSRENLAEKVEHAGRIRSWLAPWNLALIDPVSGSPFQVWGKTNRTTRGTYELRELGQDGETSSDWSWVRSVLLTPTLGDVTAKVRSRSVRS